ncbi:hypothetical protein LWI28_000750 [Acer negundo]|uniref:RNase H type-1 domain-containing protein n=1 Tax=Acer negundo TaxID=4023 RepID=A0AAD5IBA7_ACENE|nr:hypothetical protein LWI28_000750 [Acer negundo]
MNVDASIASIAGLVGVGMVVRDNMGCVMAACLKRYSNSFSIEIAESLAVLKGLELASDSNFVTVCLESDSLVAITRIISNLLPLSEFGLVLQDIKTLSSLLEVVELHSVC